MTPKPPKQRAMPHPPTSVQRPALQGSMSSVTAASAPVAAGGASVAGSGASVVAAEAAAAGAATAHVPVMMDTVMHVLRPMPGQTVVDCTVGLGGHSAALLQRVLPTGRLVGIDLDEANLSVARQRLAAVAASGAAVAVQAVDEPVPSACFQLVHGNFAGLLHALAACGVEAGTVDVLLADVGVASTQIDDPSRGFSYRRDGPLDMRMDRSRGQTAADLVNSLSADALAQALRDLGDEDDADAIARLVVQRRRLAPILTTHQLMALVCEARRFTLDRAAGAKLHPAARTFQALRILVNRELANLQHLLRVLPSVLAPGGVAAIISFHSGEDRLVKSALRDGLTRGDFGDTSRDAIMATPQEVRVNPRARSARLRWARRIRQSDGEPGA